MRRQLVHGRDSLPVTPIICTGTFCWRLPTVKWVVQKKLWKHSRPAETPTLPSPWSVYRTRFPIKILRSSSVGLMSFGRFDHNKRRCTAGRITEVSRTGKITCEQTNDFEGLSFSCWLRKTLSLTSDQAFYGD